MLNMNLRHTIARFLDKSAESVTTEIGHPSPPWTAEVDPGVVALAVALVTKETADA